MTADKPQAADTSDYCLVQITDKNLVDFTRRHNSVAWKGVLANEDYVLREHVLGKTAMTSNLYVFMLQANDDPDSYLCSIELLVRPAYKYMRENGEVVRLDIKCGCIGGVFTPRENRGKGYAPIMINKLLELAKSKLVGPEGFTFLYSEVGEYYSKMGFTSQHVPVVVIPVGKELSIRELDTFEQTIHLKDGETAKLIEYHQFEDVFNLYQQANDQELRAQTLADGKTRVTLVPNADSCDWLHLRAKFICYKLFYQEKYDPVDFDTHYDHIKQELSKVEPKYFGLELKSRQGEFIGFIVWTYDYSLKDEQYANYSTVIKIFVDTKFDNTKYTEKLIELLRNYLIANNRAHNSQSLSNFDTLKVWKSEIGNPDTITKLRGSVNDNSSLSAFLINNKFEDSRIHGGNLIWENNNKLPWF